MAEFEEVRRAFCCHVQQMTAVVQDAITGTEMRIADQALNISTSRTSGVQQAGWKAGYPQV